MPVYHYRAIGDDEREVSGTLEAPSIEQAKAIVTDDLHLEVVEMSESRRSHSVLSQQEPPQAAVQTTFAFEGKDKSGAVHRGTVQAPTKFEAFQKLKSSHALTLEMLSPLGITPVHYDRDLESWQQSQKVNPPEGVTQKNFSKKPIVFTTTDATEKGPRSTHENVHRDASPYHPVLATLRLYAGWLLAWYGLFVGLGHYVHERSLPVGIPFVEGFFLSPMIFSFTLAIFLFLLLSEIHKRIQGALISGIGLTTLGLVIFVLSR